MLPTTFFIIVNKLEINIHQQETILVQSQKGISYRNRNELALVGCGMNESQNQNTEWKIQVSQDYIH